MCADAVRTAEGRCTRDRGRTSTVREVSTQPRSSLPPSSSCESSSSFRSLSTCLSSLWDLLCEILLLFWNYKKLPRHEYVFRYSESRLAKIIKLPVQTCFCFVILPLPLHQSHLFSIRSDYISEGGKWENPLKPALSQTTLSISVILGLVVSPLDQKYRLPVTWWFFLSCLCGVF